MSARRNRRGAAVSETGPALLILVLLFFPILNLLYLAVGYCTGWYLNHLEVRELAVRKPGDADSAIDQVDTAFLNTSLAGFVRLTSANIAHPTRAYTPDESNPLFVSLTTKVTIAPFLQIPFLPGIAGVSAPIEFTYADKRPQEERNRD